MFLALRLDSIKKFGGNFVKIIMVPYLEIPAHYFQKQNILNSYAFI